LKDCIYNKNYFLYNNCVCWWKDQILIYFNLVWKVVECHVILVKNLAESFNKSSDENFIDFYFKYSFSNYSIKDCKNFFNLNQTFVKNNKIKSQFYKMWVRKYTRIQILHASNSSNNNKSDHNVHIITDEDYKSDFDKSHKHSKN